MSSSKQSPKNKKDKLKSKIKNEEVAVKSINKKNKVNTSKKKPSIEKEMNASSIVKKNISDEKNKSSKTKSAITVNKKKEKESSTLEITKIKVKKEENNQKTKEKTATTKKSTLPKKIVNKEEKNKKVETVEIVDNKNEEKKEENSKIIEPLVVENNLGTNIKSKKIKSLSSKLKEKIFEEVNEDKEEEAVKKEKTKKTFSKKKKIVLFVFIVLLLFVSCFILLKYANRIKRRLKTYDEYYIGEEVILKDKSVWYVIENSDKKTDTVKLLKKTQIDINGDEKFDSHDKKKFSTSGKAEYDSSDKNSVAYYLENDYKSYLSKNVGGVYDVGLITSKEFVKVRNTMGFGYEWNNDDNWLANKNLDVWWINSVQNGKIYVVTKSGSYKLLDASKENYIRPVIIIAKSNVNKKI